MIADFREKSPRYADFIYAKWSCRNYNDRDPRTWDHKPFEDIWKNAKSRTCAKCGEPQRFHNEIDLEHPLLFLTGHPDMVIRLGDEVSGYKWYIYEFKTIDRRDMSFDDIKMVLPDHRLQVSFYYHIMKAKGWNVSKKLRVLYIDRSNSKLFGGFPFKEFEVEPEHPELFKPFIDSLKLTKRGLETGWLPDRICPKVDCERGRGCDHAVECFERVGTHVKVHRGG